MFVHREIGIFFIKIEYKKKQLPQNLSECKLIVVIKYLRIGASGFFTFKMYFLRISSYFIDKIVVF